MDGRCHGFVAAVLRVLLEELHLEKKCGILNDIRECPDDTEIWSDYENPRRRKGGVKGSLFLHDGQ